MRWLFIELAAGLFRVDLAVKHEIEAHPELERERALPGGRVFLTRLHNHGMAGGGFTGHMPVLVGTGGLLTLGAAVGFLRLLGRPGHTVQKAGFSLLLGGALSNLYDRCKRGYVVDYIRFRTPWKRLSRLVFNLADFFIFIGTFLICLGQTDHSQR